MIKRAILLMDQRAGATPALTEILYEAGLTLIEAAREDGGQGAQVADPLAVLYEVDAGARLDDLQATVAHVTSRWPGVPLVACRRPEAPGGPERRLDAHTLRRLGFRAIADNPAQVPALLREIEEQQKPSDFPSLEGKAEGSRPVPVRLPGRPGVNRLRAAYEMVASLHFADDQKRAAQVALGGLAQLIAADRWTLYLISEAGEVEPKFQRVATCAPQPANAGDEAIRLALPGSAITERAESAAAREAAASTEVIRRAEGARRVLAAPLVNGEKVIGVFEAVREGQAARAFSAGEVALLSALAAPVACALANAARLAEAERLSLTDDLTKLHNARYLRQYLISEIKRARRYNSPVAALFLDLDDFKGINDAHGHLVGSHVLMEIAAVILSSVRDTDVVTRYGGDEFVIVLPEAEIEQASRVAERVRAKIASHVFNGGRRLRLFLTASFGVSAFPRRASSPQQLIESADAAMYEAKAAGKNCVYIGGEPAPVSRNRNAV
jgi:diguanylate cyclase (GGDEF)-like protein